MLRNATAELRCTRRLDRADLVPALFSRSGFQPVASKRDIHTVWRQHTFNAANLQCSSCFYAAVESNAQAAAQNHLVFKIIREASKNGLFCHPQTDLDD